MSRASRPVAPATPDEAQAIAAFLRELARRAETDMYFAAHLRAALHTSGLLDAPPAARAVAATPARARTSAAGSAGASPASAPCDPFALWREGGATTVRTALDALDLAGLRAIVRTYRLDPSRVSARWTARERVVELIVTQVQARANHGKAFARV